MSLMFSIYADNETRNTIRIKTIVWALVLLLVFNFLRIFRTIYLQQILVDVFKLYWSYWTRGCFVFLSDGAEAGLVSKTGPAVPMRNPKTSVTPSGSVDLSSTNQDTRLHSTNGSGRFDATRIDIQLVKGELVCLCKILLQKMNDCCRLNLQSSAVWSVLQGW